MKKKGGPPDSLSRKGSQFVNKSQLEQQQPAPHIRSSQTAALSRLADLESRMRSRNLRPSPGPSVPPAASPPPSSSAGAAQPFGLSPSSSDEQSLKGKRFLKSTRAAGVKTSPPAGPGVGAGRRPGGADGAEPPAGTEMRWTAGVSLESDEEDMKKLLGDSLSSMNSYLTAARPAAEEVLSHCTARILFACCMLYSYNSSEAPHLFIPFCLVAGEQTQPQCLHHPSPTCHHPSISCLLPLHSHTPLPCLPFQIHGSHSGPLQLLGSLSTPVLSPGLPVTYVEQQRRPFPGRALPRRNPKPPQ